jgi:hypothetical protein
MSGMGVNMVLSVKNKLQVGQSLSMPHCQNAPMNAARYFMRREDYQPPKTHPDSPFILFNVSCLKCQSYRLKIISEFDSETGETGVYLFSRRAASANACRCVRNMPRTPQTGIWRIWHGHGAFLTLWAIRGTVEARMETFLNLFLFPRIVNIFNKIKGKWHFAN